MRFLSTLLLLLVASSIPAQETIWIEAEHLEGIKGYCWPMGQPAMKKTAGHWALSGPGWAARPSASPHATALATPIRAVAAR